MRRILIIGMSDILGGVETFLYNLVKLIDKSNMYLDFLIIGENCKSVFENEINEIIGDGKNHFFYSPNLKKHYFRAKKWLKEFYRSNTYDVIYLNTCTSARILYCVDGLKKNHTKLITHSHNGQADGWSGRINNCLFKGYTTKRSIYRLACSDYAYSYLFVGEPTGTWFIPNGIDAKRFAFNRDDRVIIRKKYNILKSDVLLGCVGRLSAQKNPLFLINVIRKLPLNYKLVYIGNGELKSEILNCVSANNIETRIIIIDAVSDIERYYSAIDILLMPSVFEGLPITAIEAQCNGLHCILSDQITKQVKLSNKCELVSIKCEDEWVDSIMSMPINRYDGVKVVTDSGFTQNNTTRIIQDLLLEE